MLHNLYIFYLNYHNRKVQIPFYDQSVDIFLGHTT